MSIIFQLNDELEVYYLDLANFEVNLVKTVEPTISPKGRKHLNLADNFSILWEELWDKYLKSSDTVYLVVGPKAGFTNTRIIFLWLKSLEEIDQKGDYLVVSSPVKVDFLNQPPELILNILKTGQKDLVYNQEPRIGTI